MCVCRLTHLYRIVICVVRGGSGLAGKWLAVDPTNGTHAVWRGRLTHMEPLHQIIYLEANVGRQKSIPSDVAYHYYQEIFITAEGGAAGDDGRGNFLSKDDRTLRRITCPANSQWCDAISIFATHDVLYEEYHLEVTFVHPEDICAVDADTYCNGDEEASR